MFLRQDERYIHETYYILKKSVSDIVLLQGRFLMLGSRLVMECIDSRQSRSVRRQLYLLVIMLYERLNLTGTSYAANALLLGDVGL